MKKILAIATTLLASQQALAVDLECKYSRYSPNSWYLRIDVENKTSQHWEEEVKGGRLIALNEYPKAQMTVEEDSVGIKLFDRGYENSLSRETLLLAFGGSGYQCSIIEDLDARLKERKQAAAQGKEESLKNRKI